MFHASLYFLFVEVLIMFIHSSELSEHLHDHYFEL